MKKDNKNTAPEMVEHEETTLTVVSKNEELTTENTKPTFLTVVKNVKEENQLLAQWQKLDDTEKELDSFEFSSEHIRDSLNIKDSEGHAFSTSNTFLITKVTEMLKVLISEKKTEVEADLTRRRLAA